MQVTTSHQVSLMFLTNLTPGTINAGEKPLSPGIINAGDKPHIRYQ